MALKVSLAHALWWHSGGRSPDGAACRITCGVEGCECCLAEQVGGRQPRTYNEGDRDKEDDAAAVLNGAVFVCDDVGGIVDAVVAVVPSGSPCSLGVRARFYCESCRG